ncbi:F-box protein At3g12350-like isoform X2 [Eucalyptus grandis]|uniref:F-box protein At3g12350-like isoform X2 n=1 Tax=Eucalyptus grandis TaxID=71139 RepID=UPI00192EECFC|nr:F-box protein At3g12350-like isoform X2 [Eucalyptus grandis]
MLAQRGALCPPPRKLHRWSDASANCSHSGGVAGLGFGTRKRFASLKGIGDWTKLEFFLVTYNEIGGIACRRVGEPADRFSGCALVFWTSKAMFIEPPFSQEEVIMYDSCMHLHPIDEENSMFRELPMENELVARILYINSSYDLLIPDLAGTTATDRRNEGRIWQYRDGTFGFGFLRDNFIIDLKHIAPNGCLLH